MSDALSSRSESSERYIILYQAMVRPHLSAAAEDVGVTGIEDSHGGAPVELTAGGTELDLLWKRLG